MKNKATTIFLIVIADIVLTLLSIGLLHLFMIIGGSGSSLENVYNTILCAFVVIEFTVITGIITICYLLRKWTKKDEEKDNEKEKK